MSEDLRKAAATFFTALIAQAWEDEAFKQQLLENPRQVLQEQGYGGFLDANGEEITIKVEEATSGASCSFDEKTSTLTLYLPERPDCLKQLSFNGQFLEGACC